MPGKYLVASASAEVRESARRAFSEFAIEPVFCEGVVEAFALLERRFDGVVVDCEDVDLSLQLCRGLRSQEERGGTPVIALLPGEVAVQRALTAGAMVALHKPFRVQHLATSICVCFHVPRVEASRSPVKKTDKEKGQGAVPQPGVPH